MSKKACCWNVQCVQVKVLIGFCILPLVFTASFVILFTWESCPQCRSLPQVLDGMRVMTARFIVAPLLFQTCCSQAELHLPDIPQASKQQSERWPANASNRAFLTTKIMVGDSLFFLFITHLLVLTAEAR